MIKQVLSCDWGTSSFRLRLINVADAAVLAETTDGKGIVAVYNEWLQSGYPENDRIDFYRAILLSHIEKLAEDSLTGVPMIISGMSSSNIGITELPYGNIPFALTSDILNVKRILPDEKCGHEILIVSGLKTDNDVMRGEETMLLGCEMDDDELLIIFPGTHSKHATVKNKVLLDFKTYMTGEMFDLLSDKSILSKSVTKNGSSQYNSAFEKGIKESVEGNLLNIVFHVRTHELFKSFTREENYHYLSGLLIGSELKQTSLDKIKILLVCSQPLYNAYWQALQILRRSNGLQYCNADKALIRGHCKLANHFF